MISKLKPTTWEYVVCCEDKQGKQFLLKSNGKFSTPKKAKTYVSENGKDWTFFGNFEVCEAGKTAQSSILEMWNAKRGN